jgi:transcriptional regulator with XRE-family HTH domain
LDLKEWGKYESPDDIIKQGFRFADEDITVRNRLLEVLEEKKLTPGDLAKLTGESRQRVSNIINYETMPNIDFVLKSSYVLNTSVEKIYTLTEDAWAYKTDNESLYYDMMEKEVIPYQEYIKRKKHTEYEYFDTKNNIPLTKEKYNSIKKNENKNVHKKAVEISKEKNVTYREVRGKLSNEVKSELGKRFVRAYRKIGVKMTPYKV